MREWVVWVGCGGGVEEGGCVGRKRSFFMFAETSQGAATSLKKGRTPGSRETRPEKPMLIEGFGRQLVSND